MNIFVIGFGIFLTGVGLFYAIEGLWMVHKSRGFIQYILATVVSIFGSLLVSFGTITTIVFGFFGGNV